MQYKPRKILLRLWTQCSVKSSTKLVQAFSQSGNLTGRPVTDKGDANLEKVEQNRHISSYAIAEKLGIDQKTVLTRLQKAGYTKKLNTWVPDELTVRNLMNRVLICDSLLKHNETEPFLKRLITGDQKWFTYDENVR
ncbi:Histone-lysine N-methyltransferase SETMAR [Eumeta japonica]|uniref:Histone-lysine N-methyltransferase SETMAR n=1 Tax=Eumeta variegata TaxID=151549 RepID=A0A4C1VC18_EUMVA|nr:Histone-lysine N-methyltransferase SETMAR [Eumeta japonica]